MERFERREKVYRVTIELVGFGCRKGLTRRITFDTPDLIYAGKALAKKLKQIYHNPDWCIVARAVIEDITCYDDN